MRTSGKYTLSTVSCHPVYQIWEGMKRRCYSPKHSAYKWYGARGIKICDRWRLDFRAFAKDVGVRPSPRHQIDRIDNDGDYEPGNWRWATSNTQALNRSNTVYLKINGVKKLLVQWAKETGVNPETARTRIYRGCHPERAIRHAPLQSKFRGASFHKGTGKWVATTYRKQKCYYLGLFTTRMAAAQAARIKREELAAT